MSNYKARKKFSVIPNPFVKAPDSIYKAVNGTEESHEVSTEA
jgi:hypothetical protein